MDLLTANDRPGAYPASYYADHVEHLPPMPSVAGDHTCDVCIIGAGFTGLSTAYHLARRGYDVRVLEAQRVGFGASGRNGGQVSMGQRVDQEELEASLGKDHAQRLWAIGTQSVDLIKELCTRPEVKTGFTPGIVYPVHRKRYHKGNAAHVAHMADTYGYTDLRLLDADECRATVNSPAYHGAVLDQGAGHVNPLELVLGLARLAKGAGAQIFERSKVTDITQGDPATVRTDNARIKARHVVLACNGYLGRLQPHVASRVMPINNFIAATEPLDAQTQDQIIRHNYAVADSKFVINYFRFSNDHRLLFGGTESYGYKFPRDIAGAVRKPMTQIFPQLADVPLTHAWGGTLGITMNRMPHFERLGDNLISVSGYSGAGVGMGTLAGQITADLIAGQAERFDTMAQVPTRPFPGGAALRWPLLVLAMTWFSLRDRL